VTILLFTENNESIYRFPWSDDRQMKESSIGAAKSYRGDFSVQVPGVCPYRKSARGHYQSLQRSIPNHTHNSPINISVPNITHLLMNL